MSLENILVIVVAVVLAGLFIWAFVKLKNFRVFLGSCLGIVAVLSAVYCYIQLDFYYHLEGGIVGSLSGVFHPNQVETSVVDDVSFTFTNMELTKTGGDTYSALTSKQGVQLKIDAKESYGVFVNDAPCSNVAYVDDYIYAEYEYAFYGSDFNPKDELANTPILVDTLYFRVALYTNSIQIRVQTNGGAEAVEYWNYYFNKNAFVVKIQETDYVKGAGIRDDVDADVDFCMVKYIDNENEILSQVYLPGQQLKDIPDITYETVNYGDKYFVGWSLDGVEVLDLTSYTVASNTTFYAVYETANAGLFESSTGAMVYSWDDMVDSGKLIVEDNEIVGMSEKLSGYLYIDDEIDSLATGAFTSSSLSGVNMENTNIRAISERCFASSSVQSVAFPKRMTGIAANAFSNCRNISEIAIPETTVNIYWNAFSGCTALKSIYIPESVNFLGIYASDDALLYEKSLFKGCSSSLVIVCGASEKPTKWFNGWNYLDDSTQATTYFDYTLDGYSFAKNVNFVERAITYSYNGQTLMSDTYRVGQTIAIRDLIGVNYWNYSKNVGTDRSTGKKYITGNVSMTPVMFDETQLAQKYSVVDFITSCLYYTSSSSGAEGILVRYNTGDYWFAKLDGHYKESQYTQVNGSDFEYVGYSSQGVAVMYSYGDGLHTVRTSAIYGGDLLINVNKKTIATSTMSFSHNYKICSDSTIVYIDSSNYAYAYNPIAGTSTKLDTHKWDGLRYTDFNLATGNYGTVIFTLSTNSNVWLEYSISAKTATYMEDSGDDDVIIG